MLVKKKLPLLIVKKKDILFHRKDTLTPCEIYLIFTLTNKYANETLLAIQLKGK
jgi:hypothetical protein